MDLVCERRSSKTTILGLTSKVEEMRAKLKQYEKQQQAAIFCEFKTTKNLLKEIENLYSDLKKQKINASSL